MKFGVLTFVFIATLALASLGRVPNLQAQASPLRVTVPFDFYLADERLPAGTYIIERIWSSAVVRISDDKGHTAVALTNEEYSGLKERGKSQIVFNRYGDTYFLSEMHWEEYPTKRTLSMGSNEVDIAKTISKERLIAGAGRH
jgi:hypothetical protein